MDSFVHFLIHDGIPFTGFLLSFFVVIAWHEYAHCLLARLFGVKVLALSVGYGREIFARVDRYETRVSYHLLPFGGAITLAGQDKTSTELDTDSSNKDQSSAALFYEKPIWTQALIIAAGPISNLILAFLLLSFVLITVGEPSRPAVLTGIKIGSPADKAGLQPGDRIVEMNGINVVNFDDTKAVIHASVDQYINIKIERQREFINVGLKPELYAYQDMRGLAREYPQIGVLSQTKPIDLSAISQINNKQTGNRVIQAREMANENLGQTVILHIRTDDGLFTPYRVVLPEQINKDLKNPNALHYNNLFLDKFIDNDIRSYGFWDGLTRAGDETKRLLKDIAKIPFQALPFDKTLLDPPATMTGLEHPTSYIIYKIFYLAATMSLFLGMINLLPIPGFDGARLIKAFCDLFEKGAAIEPYVQRLSLFLFVFLVVFVNSLRYAAAL